MNLSRSPSPRAGGGWFSPGLNPEGGTAPPGTLSPNGIPWGTSKAKNDKMRGYPSFSTRNTGFFSRQLNRLSAHLPTLCRLTSHEYIDKDDYGPKWRRADGTGCGCLGGRICSMRRGRSRLLLALFMMWVVYLFCWPCK